MKTLNELIADARADLREATLDAQHAIERRDELARTLDTYLLRKRLQEEGVL